MVAKKLALILCSLSFLQTSFAGFERFWIFFFFFNTQVDDTWYALSEEEQRAVKELPSNQSANLQQRMDWFNQLPDAEKQKMREAWQKMSTQERNDLRQRMLKASADERTAIREEYINKYLEH